MPNSCISRRNNTYPIILPQVVPQNKYPIILPQEYPKTNTRRPEVALVDATATDAHLLREVAGAPWT